MKNVEEGDMGQILSSLHVILEGLFTFSRANKWQPFYPCMLSFHGYFAGFAD